MTLTSRPVGSKLLRNLFLLAWISSSVVVVFCWTVFPSTRRRSSIVQQPSSSSYSFSSNTYIWSSSSTTQIQSTPFEIDYYDDGSDNPFLDKIDSSLAVPLNTKLVVGLNKYSHDATICAANAETGEVLFALSKERLTRKKHDGGNVATLVETCLECLNLDLDAIQKVVVNNHHHRVLPLEANLSHLAWESGLGINGGTENGYDDEANLLGHAERVRVLESCFLVCL
jgi:hypothetical protein